MKEILMGFIAILSLTTAVFTLMFILGVLRIFFININIFYKANKIPYSQFNIFNQGVIGLMGFFIIIIFLGVCFIIGIAMVD